MMSTLYITHQGALVGKTSERLNVTLKKEVLAEIRLLDLSQVVLMGRVSITPPALQELARRGIELCWLTQHGEYVGRLQPELSKHSPLRLAQYRAFFDETQRLELARAFVLGKLANLRRTVAHRGKHDKNVKQAIAQIKTAERGAKNANSLDVVRGREGEGSAAYFSVFSHLIKTEKFTFTTRIRRPPTDPVNALLSFGYTLLMNDLFSAVNQVGFDPYIGYLHAEKYGRSSLSLDLMEEFRPMVVDRMVLTCLNTQILTPEHFLPHGDNKACRLSDDGRRTFLEQYERRRSAGNDEHSDTSFFQHFEQQARLLAAVLQGTTDTYTALRMP